MAPVAGPVGRLRDRARPGIEVEPGITSGDYLDGFLQGTRRALTESGRESITLTLEDVNEVTVGALIALCVHGTKATARPVINVSTFGVGAPVVSTIEDVISVVMSVVAIVVPFLVVLFLAGLVWSFVWLRRRLRRRRARRAGAAAPPTAPPRAPQLR